MKRILVYVLSLCTVLLLFGCGQNNVQQNTSQGNDGNSSEKLKVALCLTGPANDGGWCQLAYDGLTAAGEQYGVEFSYTENLQTTDMEAALTDYADFRAGVPIWRPGAERGGKIPRCEVYCI